MCTCVLNYWYMVKFTDHFFIIHILTGTTIEGGHRNHPEHPDIRREGRALPGGRTTHSQRGRLRQVVPISPTPHPHHGADENAVLGLSCKSASDSLLSCLMIIHKVYVHYTKFIKLLESSIKIFYLYSMFINCKVNQLYSWQVYWQISSDRPVRDTWISRFEPL